MPRIPLTIATISAFALGGCETVGTLGSRTAALNEIVADSSAASVLYNIVRAKEGEPLSFVTIGSMQGHATAQIGVSLPTITEGPGRSAAQKVFTFGVNPLSTSEGTDFNLNIVNDPQSYAALMRPVDTATLGFLHNMYFNSSMIYFLFISKIEVSDGKTVTVYNNEPLYRNERTMKIEVSPNFKNGFWAQMKKYIDQRLNVVVNPVFVPTYQSVENARFCFEDRTDDSPIFSNTTPAQTPNASCSAKQVEIYEAPAHAADQDLLKRLSFIDNEGRHVRVYTRSVYGAYRYLGLMLKLRELAPDAFDQRDASFLSSEPALSPLYVTHDTFGCWTHVNFEGDDWCVPKEARETKRTFAVLRTMFQLYTYYKDQPGTITVRSIQ